MARNSVELRHERASIHDRMQKIVDLAEAENRNLNAEELVNFEAAHKEQNELMARIERLEQLEVTRADGDDTPKPAAGGRLVVPTEADMDKEQAEHARAFSHYMRARNVNRDLSREDMEILNRPQNVLQTTSGAGGGYLVPPSFRAGVIEAMKAYGGMRTVATVITTSEGNDLNFATNDDTGNVGEILAEGATMSAQDTAFGMKTLKAYVYGSKVIRVSLQLLNDSAFALEPYLQRIGGTRIARIQNQHFTTGDGANKPVGVVPASTLGVTAAATGAFTYDELLALKHSVDPSYRTGARFMFHDNTLLRLKQMKDGESRPLWMAGTTTGEPDRIDGEPYTINQDMAQVATTTIPILYGAFENYYIRDVESMALMRLDELYALQLQAAFVVWTRADGALIDAGQNPIKYLQMA